MNCQYKLILSHNIFSFFFFVILLLCGCGSTDSQAEKKAPSLAPELQTLVDEYDFYINEQFALKQAPVGMAVAIIKDGQPILQKGYGVKMLGTKDSVDLNTTFRIASLSKGFTAALAAIMVEEDLLNWNSKVKQYIPNFKLHNDSLTSFLTLHHVLSHTTGLPRHTFGNLIEANIPLDQMIYQLREVPMISGVGNLFAYQNIAYSLCQPMMEKVSKKPFDSLMQQYIYDPLKMTSAAITFQDFISDDNLALPHNSRRNKIIQLDSAYYSVLPAAGVSANISDMAIWVKAMLGEYPEVLPDSILEIIFQKKVALPKNNPWSRGWQDVEAAGYGLGWRTLKYRNFDLVYHGGYVNGYRAEMAICRKEKIGIVLLSNSMSPFFFRSVPDFFDIYEKEVYSVNQDSTGVERIER